MSDPALPGAPRAAVCTYVCRTNINACRAQDVLSNGEIAVHERTRTYYFDTVLTGCLKQIRIARDDAINFSREGTGEKLVIVSISTYLLRKMLRSIHYGCVHSQQSSERLKIYLRILHRQIFADLAILDQDRRRYDDIYAVLMPSGQDLARNAPEEHRRHDDVGIEDDSQRFRALRIARVISTFFMPACFAARRARPMISSKSRICGG